MDQCLSTPILNLPQSGVLGMHNIVERPCGELMVKLKSDQLCTLLYLMIIELLMERNQFHFLKMLKENLEDPRRLFLDI